VGSKSTINMCQAHHMLETNAVKEYFNIANIDYTMLSQYSFLWKLSIILDFTSPGNNM